MEDQSEVRPLVQTMPGAEAFVLQTGGSARRRIIKPDGEAPTITFRVSGVPGHTHNASAVASVLCDLARTRGFDHDLTDAWADAAVAMWGAHIGDSDPVIDEAERFERAIERGVGEITLIPENCHQQIREPTRSIAEVRALVTPQDKLRTITYVEEVGGFVHPATGAVHISDYPDILVDMLGQQDPNDAQWVDPAGGGARYTAEVYNTPVSIRNVNAWRSGNNTGAGYHFVVLQDGANSIGTLADGSDWHGIVPFRWVQAEKRYRSDPFTVTLRRTVEVGPKAGDANANTDAVAFENEAASALTVTFPAMQTTTASNGYCLLIRDDVDAGTVLLGATQHNGENFNPRIALTNVTKPGLQSIAKYNWYGPPAYRFVVGGDAALHGPHIQSDIGPYFSILRNMTAANLANDMRARFLAILDEGADDNWDPNGNDNLNDPNVKFNNFFLNLNLGGRKDKYPIAGLPQNAEPGATWYPLRNTFPTVTTCQRVLGYDGAGVADTGQEVVRKLLLELPANAANADAWRDSDIEVSMNGDSMKKVFDAGGIVPPGILALGDDATFTWMQNVAGVGEVAQANAENAVAVQIAALTTAITDQEAILNAGPYDEDSDFVTIVAAAIAIVNALVIAVANAQAAYDAQVQVVAQAQGAFDMATPQTTAALLATLQEAQADLVPLAAALQLQQANYQAALAAAALAQANQAALAALIAARTARDTQLPPLQAELARLVGLRVPHFDEWYTPRYDYNGKIDFSIKSELGEDIGGTHLEAFDEPAQINQKMMMVRQQLAFYKAGAVQTFAYNAVDVVVTHTHAISYTPFYHVLCDTTGSYGQEPVVRASGSIKTLFELPTYIDMDDGNEVKEWHVRSLSLPPDARAAYREAIANGDGPGAAAQNNNVAGGYPHFVAMGVGNALEVLMPMQGAAPDAKRPQLIGYQTAGTTNATFIFQDLAFAFEEPRLFFMSLNNIGHKNAQHTPTVYYFLSSDCVTEARQQTVGFAERIHVCTRVTKAYTWGGNVLAAGLFATHVTRAHGDMAASCCLCQMGPDFQDLWFGEDGTTTVFDAIKAESRLLGPVFRSRKRISQHLCAPILNPNARLQCSAPLNYETRHLPPELRDFVIRLQNVDWSFLPGKVEMEPLTLYEFNGGNQTPAVQDNLLHLPQFRQGSTLAITDDGKFDFEVFSPYGMPSYLAVFVRDTDFRINYKTQPIVTQLSIMCNTTMKKSNTVLNADVHQLYHITQRNVHPRAEYDRFDFNKRQVILLRAEDIGLVGLKPSEYQYEKRAVFRFQGSVDQIGEVTALLIYNNRGLYVHGKQLSVERLVR